MRLLGVIMALLLAIASASIVANAWGSGHPDRCQPCHGATTQVTDLGMSFWSHQVEEGDAVWANCINCHSDYTFGTVHDELDCKGCHAVLHIGYYNGTNYAAALWYWEVSNPGGKLLIAPSVTSLVKKKLLLDSSNASIYVPNIANYVGTEGEEVEVGLWDAYANKYIETSPNAGTPDTAFRVCFSCHFLASDPASVGVYKVIGGKWKIGIPPAALEQPAHEIYPVSFQEGFFEETGNTPAVIALAIGLAGLIMVVIGRGRGA